MAECPEKNDAANGSAASPTANRPCCITHFDMLYAPQIAAWVRSEQELSWLAPGTPPPLTAAKVAAWGSDGRRLLFWSDVSDVPVGYAEINKMAGRPDQMWIGHCVIDPVFTGRGLGGRFVHGLLALAFDTLAADRVLLVVFPDNKGAIRCYEKNGMTITGRERRYFKKVGREHVLLRMEIDRRCFERIAASTRPPVAVPLVQGKSPPWRSATRRRAAINRA